LRNMPMETAERPVGDASHQPVFHRVVMDVIDVPFEIDVVADGMLPTTALPLARDNGKLFYCSGHHKEGRAVEQFFTFLENADKVLLVAGICLLALAVLRPEQMRWIVIDFTPMKSVLAGILGVIFIILASPQVRAFHAPQVDASGALVDIRRNVQTAHGDAIGATTNTSDLRGCISAAGRSAQASQEALSLIDALSAKLKPAT